MTEQCPSFEERRWIHEQHTDRAKWEHELKRADALRAHDANRDMHAYFNKAAIESANLALRTLVVINGGAALAILTFLGGLASKTSVDLAYITSIASTIEWFALGVAAAMLGLALAYLTHYSSAAFISSRINGWEHPYQTDGPRSRFWRRTEVAFHIFAIIAAITALVLFLLGMFTASYAVSHLVQR